MNNSDRKLNGVSSDGIKPRTLQGRLTLVGVGHIVNKVLVYPFDYVLYPYIIWKFGIIKGAPVMAVLSLFYCWLTILFYNWAKTDFLGLEMLKEVRSYNGAHFWGRIFGWLLAKGDVAVFLFLSTRDPFMATVFMRKDVDVYSGLTQRDWLLLVSSVVIGTVYWTLAVYMGISLVEWAWKAVAG